jgi:IS30 family transposase
VSHETIYNTLYAHPRGELRQELLGCLRWARSKRRSRSAGQNRSRLSDALSIQMREPAIGDQVLPGLPVAWRGVLHFRFKTATSEI